MADLDPPCAGVVTGSAPTVAFGPRLGRGWGRQLHDRLLHRTDPVGGFSFATKQQMLQLAQVVLPNGEGQLTQAFDVTIILRTDLDTHPPQERVALGLVQDQLFQWLRPLHEGASSCWRKLRLSG